MSLFTPINQKRLTNISVVRLKKGGLRFELACYPNKILNDGELQLTEKERGAEQNALFKDVAKIISDKCINPETCRSYTATMIEKMMRDCHISLRSNKTAKQHSLEVIRQFRENHGLKIAPALLEVVLSLDAKYTDLVRDQVDRISVEILRHGVIPDEGYSWTIVLEPDKYGALENFLHTNLRGKFCIEIVGTSKRSHPLTTSTSNTKPNDKPRDDSYKSQPSSAQAPPLAEKTDGDQQQSTSDSPSCATGVVEKQLQDSKKIPSKTSNRHRKRKQKQKKDDWPDSD